MRLVYSFFVVFVICWSFWIFDNNFCFFFIWLFLDWCILIFIELFIILVWWVVWWFLYDFILVLIVVFVLWWVFFIVCVEFIFFVVLFFEWLCGVCWLLERVVIIFWKYMFVLLGGVFLIRFCEFIGIL